MLTSELTTRQDLVQSLDAESIYDYLIQHGVLDEATRDKIHNEENKVQRNKSLLEHLQGTGDASVALFINALRQSGQLGLASSLDVNSRIKPTYGYGYLGKERHKGQVTIKILVDSIKALFPKQEEGDQLEEKHGDTPEKEVKSSGASLSDLNVLLTPRRMHKSYENMTMIEDQEGITTSPRAWRIKEYAYDPDARGQGLQEEEEEDASKSRGFCWCLCIPRKKRSKKNKPQNGKDASLTKCPQYSAIPMERLNQVDSPAMSTNSFSPKRGTKTTHNGGSKGNSCRKGNVQFDNVSREATHSTHSTTKDRSFLQSSVPNNVDNKKSRNEKKVNKCNVAVHKTGNGKENKPPTTPQKTVKQATMLTYDQDSLSSDKQEPVEFCIMWKSRGPTFDAFATKFKETVDKDSLIRSQIVKYFEQERGTLVLSVYCEDTLVICNICMTVEQITTLQKDERSGQLTEVLESMLLKKSVIDEVGVMEMKIQVVVDDDEIELAQQELS